MADLTLEEIQAMSPSQVREVEAHIDVDSAPESITAHLLLMLAATLILALRLVSRAQSSSGLGRDDALLAAAWTRLLFRYRRHLPLDLNFDFKLAKTRLAQSRVVLLVGGAMALLQCLMATATSRRF